MASTSETITLCKILAKARTIVNPHKQHFRALTFLFCFPLSLCLIVYPIPKTTNFPQSLSDFIYSSAQNPSLNLLFILLRTIFTTLFSLCAVATISFSTYRAISGEPLVLIESIKSIRNSFLPIICTQIVVASVQALVFVPFMILLLLAYKWVHPFGVEDVSNLRNYFLIFVIFITLVCVVLVTYLQVNWILAYVVVVVESKRGFEALKRSANLIKGNRGVALSIQLFYGLLSGSVVLWFLYVSYSSSISEAFLYLICASIYLSCFLFGNLLDVVILYVDCRDLHEGLPLKDEKNTPLLN